MKRIITVLVCLMIVLSFAFSSDPIEGSTPGSATGENITTGMEPTAYTKITMALGTGSEGDEDPGQKVVVGFTANEVKDTEANIKSEITAVNEASLTLDSESGIASLDSGLHAFWQIQSGKELAVKIYAGGPLTASGVEGGTLDWTITAGSGEDAVEIGSSDYTTPQEIYTHQSDDTFYGHAGSVPITIETHNYTQKPKGDYEGYIYIAVYNP